MTPKDQAQAADALADWFISQQIEVADSIQVMCLLIATMAVASGRPVAEMPKFAMLMHDQVSVDIARVLLTSRM